MKTIKRKKIMSMVMALMVFFCSESILTHAASISQISESRPSYGVVINISSNSYLRVHPEPNLSSEEIAKLYNDDCVMIIGQSGNFYHVKYDKHGSKGYVYKDYVSYVDTTGYLVCAVDEGTLYMRSGAGTSYGELASIPKGTAFAYITQIWANGWYRGVYGNIVGYTSGEYTDYVAF